jgi:hypothetical protein
VFFYFHVSEGRYVDNMEYKQLNLFGEDISNKVEHRKTIISASRRTDIPAFFYDWLQDRLSEGQAVLRNPYFQNKEYCVDLRPDKVHSMVLWSKDFKKVMNAPRHLENYNLYFQYTINHYSRKLEPKVPEYRDTIHVLEGLLKRYKPQQFNIRFDPVIVSLQGEISSTPDCPEDARLNAFEQLCSDIKTLGMEECRVTTSYLSIYGHVRKAMEACNVDLVHLNEERQILFFTRMTEIAEKYGISIYSCASPVLEQVKGINRGHCIDGELLEQLFGGRVTKSKDKGQRLSCGCSGSRDIGNYARGTDGMRCQHNCKYCYVMS